MVLRDTSPLSLLAFETSPIPCLNTSSHDVLAYPTVTYYVPTPSVSQGSGERVEEKKEVLLDHATSESDLKKNIHPDEPVPSHAH